MTQTAFLRGYSADDQPHTETRILVMDLQGSTYHGVSIQSQLKLEMFYDARYQTYRGVIKANKHDGHSLTNYTVENVDTSPFEVLNSTFDKLMRDVQFYDSLPAGVLTDDGQKIKDFLFAHVGPDFGGDILKHPANLKLQTALNKIQSRQNLAAAVSNDEVQSGDTLEDGTTVTLGDLSFVGRTPIIPGVIHKFHEGDTPPSFEMVELEVEKQPSGEPYTTVLPSGQEVTIQPYTQHVRRTAIASKKTALPSGKGSK